MKAIIDSSKRRDSFLFTLSLALLTCILFLLCPSCQKEESNQDPILNVDLMSSSILAKSSSVIFYYDPVSFPMGLSQVDIKNEYYMNFEKTFILKVQNGSSASDPKASTVEIKIDGKLIITSSDFNKANLVVKKVLGLTYGSKLEVSVANSEITSIKLWIEGTLINELQGRMKDIEGNTYKTVKIGDQWWMAENLKVTKYRDRTPIVNVKGETEWSTSTTGAYCWYNNNPAANKDYGILYNMFAIDDSRQLCPTGWHVPTFDDWTKLISYLGGESVTGGKLKETGTSHWESPNLASNVTGFTALGGGYRYADGNFGSQGRMTYIWSSSAGYNVNKDIIYINNDYTGVTRAEAGPTFGLYVRCIKGEGIPPLAVGQSYQGGVIAYIFQQGDPGYIAGETHGLIAASSDQSTGIIWYNGDFISTGATATAIGTGDANTNTIVNTQGSGDYAAKICYDLSWGGYYLDWYLPSKEELDKLYLNRTAIGGFGNNGYWSSTEADNNLAWGRNFTLSTQGNYSKNNTFSLSTQGNYSKNNTFSVRAVRSF